MENISRGPTFGDFVTIRTEASMQDVQGYRVQEYRLPSESPVLEILNNPWGLGTEKNRIVLRPARLHSLAELVPWNQFLGP